VKFVTGYEKHRPVMTEAVTIDQIPQHHSTWKKNDAKIVDDIWCLVRKSVDECEFYGLGVDGGLDEVLHLFVLVLVLYVKDDKFELPPIYEEKGEAFDGRKSADAIIGLLKANFGERGVLKLRYMLVDGCTVNAVCKEEVNAQLRLLFKRYIPFGDSDWSNLTHGLIR
jgi:hypothetical protein